MENKLINNQFKAFKLLNEDNLLYIFNGICLEEPSIEELIELKKLLDSTIDNYGYYIESVKVNSKELKDSYTASWKKIATPKKEKEIKKGFVYIAFCKTTFYYKIGMTRKSVESRMKQLKTANPSIELSYCFAVKDISVEKKLHNIFKHKNISNEWFDLDDKDINKIKKIIYES
jgi:hypothetical protein